MKRRVLTSAILLGLVGCTTESFVGSSTPEITVGNVLGERVATHRMSERLICYYEVINPNNGRSFSAVLPTDFKTCPDHVIKNSYTNQIDWGKQP